MNSQGVERTSLAHTTLQMQTILQKNNLCYKYILLEIFIKSFAKNKNSKLTLFYILKFYLKK